MTYTDTQLKNILTQTKRIAVVGASLNPVRPSYYVTRYLKTKGYDIVPVNPAHAGKTLRSETVPEIVDEALQVFPDLATIWMQIGVQHSEAAAKAEAKGVTVIQNRCPKIEYQRLFGELRMGGFATGIISSKL